MSDTNWPFSKLKCQKIVERKLKTESFTLLSSQQLSFGRISGFLGDHSNLKISINRNGTEEKYSFFVKSIPKVKSQRNFLFEINGFFKENFFFTKYLNLLDDNSINILEDVIPTCLHIDGENFVFEDLTLDGYTTLQARGSLDVKSVKAALTSLAKLHASGIILEERSDFKLNERFQEEFSETFYDGNKPLVKATMKSFKHGFEALIDLTHGSQMKIPKDLFKEEVYQSLDLQEIFVKSSAKFRNTICHGDLWTNNMMFKFEDNKLPNCAFVDFQSYRYVPPAQDVMDFLHLNTDRDFRTRHMEEMLHFYHQELNENFTKFGLSDVITKEEFFTSCQHYKQFALTDTCAHFQIVLMSEETANELFEDQDKVQYILFENKYDFVVDACNKDEIYRRMNFDALAELREYCEEANK